MQKENKVIVKLNCFPGPCRTGENRGSRFFVSDGKISVRSKIGRCRITTFRQNTDFIVGLTPDLHAKQRGFTLIELLVVVLIIGILAAVAVPQYEQAVMKSRYATLKANVKSIYEAQQLYFLANGKFAEDFEELSIDLAGCTLSEDKKQCIYPWGKCHFTSGNGGLGRGVCQNTTTLKNAYVRHWQGGKSTQTCWAFTENPNDKYGKLCEREGGVYDGSSTCTHAFGSVCQTYPITK